MPEVMQVTDYYPFGLVMNQENYFADGVLYNKYLYNNKELQDDELAGNSLGWYDYGARMYDPALGRFHTQDRFSEKYYSLSIYQYAANNPILFIDVNGDSINVAEQYRDQFNSALESVFGANAKNFSYNSSGNLVYNGSKKDFKGDAKKMFKQVNKVMGEATATNVIYEETHTVTLNDGTNYTIDTKQHSGAAALTVFDSKGLSNENYVVVDPNASKTFTVNEMGPAYYNGTPATTTNWWGRPVTVNTSTENSTWHEIGHVIHQGKTQDNVINFDNRARLLNQNRYNYTNIRTLTNQRVYIPAPMSPRPYDATHNRLIK